ncbi:nucleotidyltransferase family protein [Streptococcus anginosus]|uniref:nucleotidyltransferase family protein n=1 Tax=Streptococcus anginosus TaxID=1328 RepID=UPI0040426705
MLSEKEILHAFSSDQDIMTILQIIYDLQLKDSWLCAGSVRNFIWNRLSNQPGFDKDTDVDVIFFDPAISYEETLKIETKLKENYPNYSWELKNQVYMHIHNPNTEPYRDSRDAMSKYPERCTAIGLRLLDNDQLELFAPYGLDDILEFRIASTPHFLTDPARKALYEQRLSKKNWQKKWNNLQIEFL